MTFRRQTVIKNSLVNIEKRQKDILELLQQTEQLSTFELAESLDVSISTIRRDLNLLEEKRDHPQLRLLFL